MVWAAVGAIGGLVAGVLAAEWVGRVSRQALPTLPRQVRRRVPAPAQVGQAARAVLVALKAEPTLAGCTLECIPAGRAAVELRGWVPTRTLRARATRLAQDVPGIEHVINSILVHGEDDRELASDPDPASQSA